jgi:hypothetical protein
MKTVWHLVMKELKTQDIRLFLLLPLPLIFFYAMLQPIFQTGAYTIVIVLMTYFLLAGNNHKQLDYKFDRIILSLPVTRHEMLLSKYAMVIVWYILAAIICNAIGTVYMLYYQMDIRLSSPMELALSLSAVLLIAGIYYPLYYLFDRKFLYINIFLFTVMFVAGPSISRSVPEIVVRFPLMLLPISVAVFALSFWFSFLIFQRARFS